MPKLTAAAPAATSARFALTMSMSAPAGICVSSPASPLAVRMSPTLPGTQPRSAK